LSIISVQEVHKSYRKSKILKGISLRIKEGHIVGLLGPNGSGKSTLLKIISGLVVPSSGEVEIKQLNIKADLQKIMEKVGVLIESPGIYDYLNAFDNVYISSKLHGQGDKEKAHGILKRFDLDSHSKVHSSKYSTGMKQRLGLCMALVHEPDILILDEPTNGLDADGIVFLRNVLKNYKAEGNTVVMATHLLSEAQAICDDIILIRDGVIIDQFSYRDGEGNESEILSLDLKGRDGSLIGQHLAALNIPGYRMEETFLELIISKEKLVLLLSELANKGVHIQANDFAKISLEDYYLRKVAGLQ